MFVFPVMYKENDQEEAKLCSYVPVLYLDSKLGVIGGLYYGLRKEFHPEMTHNTTQTASSWYVKDIIQAAFQNTGDQMEMPQFIKQSFDNPFVTISYFSSILVSGFGNKATIILIAPRRYN